MKAKIYIYQSSIQNLKEGLIVNCSETDTGIQIEVDVDKLFCVQYGKTKNSRGVETTFYIPDMELSKGYTTYFQFEEVMKMIKYGHIDGREAAQEFVNSRKKEQLEKNSSK